MMDKEEESRKTTLAIIEFGFKFAEYIKEMDYDLWKRAIDYAKDWTEVEGISFHYMKDKDEKHEG